MENKLKNIFRSRRVRTLEGEVAELRLALAGVLASGKTPDGSEAEKNEIDAVLFHAATSRVEADRLRGLYESAVARISVLEDRLEALERKK